MFNLRSALEAIRNVEASVAGVVTTFDYEANPDDIGQPEGAGESVLPAILHYPRGLTSLPTGSDASHPLLEYRIDSLLLVSEAESFLADDWSPGDEYTNRVLAAFSSRSNIEALEDAALAHSYRVEFVQQSFSVRQYPPVPAPKYRWYWSLLYTHVFGVQ